MSKIDNPIINLWRYQWKYSKGRRYYLLVFSLLFVIANIITIMEPYVLGNIFTVIQTDIGNPDFLSTLFLWIGLLAATTIGFWAFHGPARSLERFNGFKVGRDYRMDLLRKVMDLPASWHRDHHSGDTIDKISRASSALEGFSQRNFVVFEMIIRAVGPIIALVLLDMKAAAVAIIVTLVTLWGLNRFDKILVKQLKKLYKSYNHSAAGIHDYVSNIVTVITLRMQSRVAKEILARLNKPYQLFKKNAILNEVKWSFASTMIQTMIVIVLGWTAYDSYKTTGTIIIGTLYMLYGYLERVGDTFYQFAYRYGTMVEEDAKVKAAEGLFEAYENNPVYKHHHLPKKWKTVEINGLNFSYGTPTKKGRHLENINLTLKRGQNIALIGTSGSGKSTTMALLRGLYTTDEVQVLADGKVLENGLNHVHGNTALIPQDPEIFNATIKENICMGMKYPQKLLKKVLDQARFTPVLKNLPKGLETNVMEKGVSLSGGQKQRLALARGLLAGQASDILLMDEPTSSVDSPNEIAIYEKILRSYRRKTIISSIHRLNLLSNFDYIYLFKKGKIVAEGSFRQLLKNKHFKPVWNQYTKKKK